MNCDFAGVELCTDLTPADWVLASLRPWNFSERMRVNWIVPPVYPAYARVFHEAWLGDQPVPWSTIATVTGKPLDVVTRFDELVEWRRGSQAPPPPWREPEPGSLQRDECTAIAETLAGFTTTPDDCRLALWEGYGWDEIERCNARAPRVPFEHRACLLFRGPVAAATAFHGQYGWFQSPTRWWPDDRAWCVASELDIYSTYVGGSVDAIRALLDTPHIEALECSADDLVDTSQQ